MLINRTLSSLAIAGLMLGGITLGCDVEEDPFESRSAQQVGGPISPPTRDFPPRPGQQCGDEAQGSGAWCDCMGQAIDDLTPWYEACDEVLHGEGPLDITLWTWCTQLDQDFDDWWDNC